VEVGVVRGLVIQGHPQRTLTSRLQRGSVERSGHRISWVTQEWTPDPEQLGVCRRYATEIIMSVNTESNDATNHAQHACPNNKGRRLVRRIP
jgi:hypothetical protein